MQQSLIFSGSCALMHYMHVLAAISSQWLDACLYVDSCLSFTCVFRYLSLFCYVPPLQQAKEAERGQFDQTTRRSVWCVRKTGRRVSCQEGVFGQRNASWACSDCVLFVGVAPMAAFLKPFIRSRARWWLSSRFPWSRICRRSSRRFPSCSSVTGSDTTQMNYTAYTEPPLAWSEGQNCLALQKVLF